MSITIRTMQEQDIDGIAATFAHWNKTRAQYERYWQEHQAGERVTLVTVADQETDEEADDRETDQKVVAYGNIIWQPDYPPFQQADIPEINDLNVVEGYQRQGIATALIHEMEQIAQQAGKRKMGIAYGLTPDYATAQRLYPKLGYQLDGRGPYPTPWGDILCLVKELGGHTD